MVLVSIILGGYVIIFSEGGAQVYGSDSDQFGCPGGTPYNGLYGEAPPERGTFFRLQV